MTMTTPRPVAPLLLLLLGLRTIIVAAERLPLPCDLYATGGTPCVAVHSISVFACDLTLTLQIRSDEKRRAIVLGVGGIVHAP